MEQRAAELNQITAATITATYDDGSVFALRSDRDGFQSDTFRALREHDFKINRQESNKLYVEKHPDWRRHR